MKKCLVLVDLQNDYFPGGKMELVAMERAATQGRRLLDAFRRERLPIVHVQHIAARPGATFFLPDTIGARIHETVAPGDDETVITKHFPNSFRDTTLLSVLQKKGVDTLVICGAMSHMCIDATTRAAFDYGFNCFVAEDGCATRDLVFQEQTVAAAAVHAAFMAALAVPYAQVMSTDSLLTAIQPDVFMPDSGR